MTADERDPARLTDTLFRKGWASVLPPSGIDIIEVLGDGRAPSRDDIDARLRARTRRLGGLESPAWLPTDIWPRRDGPEPAVGSSAETSEFERDAHVDRATQFARHLASKGLPVGYTVGSLLRLLVACEVVTVSRWGDYSINPVAPAAADASPTRSGTDAGHLIP